ncbi:MAG: T9SS type A sorting domain-containing protein [bacterium]|nr:T9SS type A sorting domain-containing protein [bacterium]
MNKVVAHFLALIVPLVAILAPAQADVLLSELCDPRYNYQNDRFIEIYNSGTEAVTLTGWQVIAVGNSSDIFTWSLSGQIEPGEALVCGDATTTATFPVDFPQEAWSDNNGTWNGKVGDGAKLRNSGGSIIDYAVVPGTTFENQAIERNEGVDTPSPSWNGAEWTASSINNADDATPGEHHAPPPPVGPTIQSVAIDPDSPQVGEDVDASAVVLGNGSTVSSVELQWGLTSGNLTNIISMPLYSGNYYTSESPIPTQASGDVVYYRVAATNEEDVTSHSAEYNFELPWSVTVAGIQGAGTISPHVGHNVTTDGIVTADYGSTWVIQDGTGARSGLWIQGGTAPALGSSVTVMGQIQELNNNTTMTSATVITSSAGSMPAAANIGTNDAGDEDYEGVLIQVVEAECTIDDAINQQWYINTSGNSLRVDNTGYTYSPSVGSVYTVTGPVSDNSDFEGIVPRDASDIIFVADPEAPSIININAPGPNTVMITFSETVEETSAETTANYIVSGSSVQGAQRIANHVVELTVSNLSSGSHNLTVHGVTDLQGNAMNNVVGSFTFYGGNIPDGYYDSAIGLDGEELRLALHNIIDGHNAQSYSGLWTAFYTTDARPDGTVWDMYSDVPGGIPPYVYEFGVDQGGGGATEGTGYNREHSWPQSWYGGASPMYTDLFVLYPTDVRVNGMRSNHAFGEVGSASWTSLNGSKVGSNSYPGYSGTVFEPIDAYKGDFARAYFYMTARYYTEDGSWDNNSPMANRSQLLPWAEAMLLEWHENDPVSVKETDRNDAVYDIQNNRNPFIDRPDFVYRVFTPELSDTPTNNVVATILLHQNAPNPFNPSTTISYELNEDGPMRLEIFDMAGRLVRILAQENQVQGRHELNWNGRNREGRVAAAGVYFYRLSAEGQDMTKRMLLVK